MRSFVLAVLLLGACGPKSDPAPAPVAQEPAAAEPAPAEPAPAASISDAELDALMQEATVFFGKVADAVTAAGSDCPKMAASINAVVDQHADLLARAAKFDEDADAEARADAWMAAHEDQMKPIFERLMTGLGPCQGDPAVGAALDRMSSKEEE